MSELFDKQLQGSVQKEFEGKLTGFMQALTSPQKVCNENETKKQIKKNLHVCKNVFDGKKHYIYKTHK